jgi:ATP-dependent RNA helicase HelY
VSEALRAEFLSGLPFELDPFQLEAMDALDNGHSVVVAAPTGSGKTVVAEYAVARALASGAKAFYTTPLKALSNQKFADFSRRYGAAKVGLLTGDNAINGDAPVVVMTTEVLRNMVYAGSESLLGLRYVVLDEVHYLQDPYRGPVWEEVIIHLAPEVDLVCLSATVSNAEELADWVGTVRGSTRAVIEERRPIPLHNLFLVGDRRSEGLVLLPTFVDDRPNPRGGVITARADAGWRAHRRSGLFVPHRAETVDLLAEEGYLPAIYFIFSRAGCDEAVGHCMREGRRLTSAGERRQIRQLAEATAGHLSDADLDALGYGNWLAGLEAGFAAHHAGLVPPFKEAVERCFGAGLVKVVFATETLSLGVNMPARCVVIEKLYKFGGERVEPLTPGEYTQLTGRAGRRGTDEVGYAVVVWSANVTFEQVASLAGARSYTLTSSFHPTYNMATNLVRRCSPEEAHHLLNLSFAQYRADSDVVRFERHLERARLELARAREDAACELGDVFEYRRLDEAASTDSGPERPHADLDEIVAAMEGVRPGDVLALTQRKPGGLRADDRVAIISKSQRKKGDVRLRAVTTGRRLVSLVPRDFRSPPHVVDRVALPSPYDPQSKDFRRRVATSLARSVGGARAGAHAGAEEGPNARSEARPEAGPGAGPEEGPDDASPGRSRRRHGAARAASHPVAACPLLREHLRAAARAERLARQMDRLENQVLGRTGSLALQFDRVLQLLERWGYVRGWALTGAGGRLARIYHEQDLLVAECAERGMFDGLKVPEMAGLASVFTYEARGPSSVALLTPKWPSGRLDERWRAIEAVAHDLAGDEQGAGLPVTRAPDAGFAALAYGWARGQELGHLLAPLETGPGARGTAISAGDFVRNVKQLIDLLRQLGQVLPDEASAAAARQAAEALFRGVVAASSVVSTPRV